jgi:hypothetical protein
MASKTIRIFPAVTSANRLKESLMKFNVSLKYVALGVATGLLGFASAAFAQAGSQDLHLVGVNVRLDHTIDTDTVKPGQAVTAKLDGAVTTNGGVKLEKGTELEGTVAAATPSSDRGPASLSLLFTTAKLRDGKQVPVKVTLLAAYPASESEDATYGDSAIAPPPQHVNPQESVIQEPGLLGNNVKMKSAVQGQDSGTFSKTNGNFRLLAGTYFQAGIAATNGAGTAAGE